MPIAAPPIALRHGDYHFFSLLCMSRILRSGMRTSCSRPNWRSSRRRTAPCESSSRNPHASQPLALPPPRTPKGSCCAWRTPSSKPRFACAAMLPTRLFSLCAWLRTLTHGGRGTPCHSGWEAPQGAREQGSRPADLAVVLYGGHPDQKQELAGRLRRRQDEDPGVCWPRAGRADGDVLLRASTLGAQRRDRPGRPELRRVHALVPAWRWLRRPAGRVDGWGVKGDCRRGHWSLEACARFRGCGMHSIPSIFLHTTDYTESENHHLQTLNFCAEPVEGDVSFHDHQGVDAGRDPWRSTRRHRATGSPTQEVLYRSRNDLSMIIIWPIAAGFVRCLQRSRRWHRWYLQGSCASFATARRLVLANGLSSMSPWWTTSNRVHKRRRRFWRSPLDALWNTRTAAIAR